VSTVVDAIQYPACARYVQMSWQSAKGRLDFVGENESTFTVCLCEVKNAVVKCVAVLLTC